MMTANAAMPPKAHSAELVAASMIQSRAVSIQPPMTPPVPTAPYPMRARDTHWSLRWWRTVADTNGPLSVHGCQSPWTRKNADAKIMRAMPMWSVTKLMASMGGSPNFLVTMTGTMTADM